MTRSYHQFSELEAENTYLNAAHDLGIAFEQVKGAHRFWLLGGGDNRIWLSTANLGVNTCVSRTLTSDKAAIHTLLHANHLPSPQFLYRRLFKVDYKETIAEIQEFAESRFPVVIKPNSSFRSRGVQTDIRTPEELAMCLARHIAERYRDVVVEEHKPGAPLRILMLDGEIVDMVRWTPVCVHGDGRSTVRQLISRRNKNNPDLPDVEMDEGLVRILDKQGAQLDKVLPDGANVELRQVGRAAGVQRERIPLENVPDSVKQCLLKVSQVTGLRFFGVDALCEDIDSAAPGKNFFINEVNTGPGIGLKYHGTSENDFEVAKEILRRIFNR